SKAHKVLDEWLSEKESFKLQLVFSTQNEENDPRTKVARHLHQLQHGDKRILREAIHDWYEHKYKDFNSWTEAYPLKDIIENLSMIEKQKAWCKYTEIRGT